MRLFRRLLILSVLVLALIFLARPGLNQSRVSLGPSQADRKTFIPPSKSPPSSFRFAVLADIHSDLENLQKSLERIRQDKAEFIIIAGDLTISGKTNEFKQVKAILDKNDLPYFVVPGNHDLWSIRGKTNPFREVFGEDFQVFSKDKIKFILINNGDGLVGVEGITGLSGQKQDEWLKQELADCPKLYCLVFGHMPLNHPSLGHIMGEDSPEVASQAARLVKELTDYQVKEYFAGHIHYLSSYELNGLKTTTTGAIFTNKNTQVPRFMEATLHLPEVKLEKKEIWLNQ